jgi:hypothetical protein
LAADFGVAVLDLDDPLRGEVEDDEAGRGGGEAFSAGRFVGDVDERARRWGRWLGRWVLVVDEVGSDLTDRHGVERFEGGDEGREVVAPRLQAAVSIFRRWAGPRKLVVPASSTTVKRMVDNDPAPSSGPLAGWRRRG